MTFNAYYLNAYSLDDEFILKVFLKIFKDFIIF
jgi:hypothetical protein